ncbi:MAG: hypothetical protein AAF709_06010, partial [Pseudomonadota bacterium]
MIRLARDLRRAVGFLAGVLCFLATAQMSHMAQATERTNVAKKPGSANLEGHGGPVKAIAVDHASGRILTGSFDYAMMLWQLSEDGYAKQIKRFADHDGAVSAVGFVPGANQALSSSDDGALHLWDLETGKRLQLMKGHGAKILGLDISSDGSRAITASWDRTIRIWDLQTGKT